MILQWRRNEAWADGRLVFAVVRERNGWLLYRYSTRLDGSTHFKSKEGVRTRAAGRAYAERLWRLSGGRDLAP